MWYQAVVLALLLTAPGYAAEPTGLAVEGTVSAVDPLAHRFEIVATSGERETFRVAPATIVRRGDERLHDQRLEPGQRVRVQAVPGGAPRLASEVELLALGQDPEEEPGRRAAEVFTVAHGEHGPVLVDSSGRALYAFSRDETGEGSLDPATSHCEAACASAWPPLLTHGPPLARDGAETARLTLFERERGVYQASYDGWPLYRYAGDEPFRAGAGGTTGGDGREAFGGRFRLVPAAGFPER